ncbi:B-cell receptor CD22-like [Cheilinus undulatus]|uniref:B-cell receptor CD22-like n=1 Tax=Cheilinus undulatus TaxID=241271 RepID=UPI001BD3A135|nr:B-cell receptor CD22-like [Cheilinus undulatus]
MHLKPRNLTCILKLLFLTGVLCNTWKVEYQQQHICAIKGSSVVFLCSFFSPGMKTVRTVKWGHATSQRLVSDSNSVQVSSRFQYIGDRRHNCSLKIHQVEKRDAGKYNVRLLMAKGKGFLTRNKSLSLRVVALSVFGTKLNTSRSTKEGDPLNLTCVNSCDGANSSSAFTWFKNGEVLHEGPVLYLSHTSISDSGNYSCSLKTQPAATSAAVHVDVEYGPKNTLVSVTPSVEVYTGSNFTLICSSNANPPVENYTWFKKDNDDEVVGHQSLLFSSQTGRYFCSAANKHGRQNSSDVTIKTKSTWMTFTRDVLCGATAVVLQITITLCVITRCHKRRTWMPTVDCEEDVQDTDYVNWLTCDINQSQEDHQREEGPELIYATIDFSST